VGEQKNGSSDQGAEEGIYHHEGGNLPTHGHHDEETLKEDVVRLYWRANLKLLGGLLVIWFVVSFGFSILFVDVLNEIPLFGFKLGFWWAQQGAIYVFVALIFVYVVLMKRIERRFGVDDD
jgi:putative solute:sodium symporter small subunit|tara:strand:- start:400 stop:762 length:363 start_codon:yes stop_codon:yes gene_type:complete